MKLVVFLPLALHVYIFWLETFGWGKSSSVKAFQVKQEEVEVLRPWAFNQGWYNLFLVAAGLAGFFWSGIGGAALVTYALGSMVAAALVLALSSPQKLRSALIQGIPAVLGLVFFWIPG